MTKFMRSALPFGHAKNWMLAAILICGASVLTSCSNEDNNGQQTKLNRSDYDEDRPVGWAESVTGGEVGNTITVTTPEELKTALESAEKYTIYVRGQLRFNSLMTVKNASDKTVIGEPGSVLYNDIHSDVVEESGILLLEECQNIVLRNLTFKSAGAYDIDGYDNLALSKSQNIWVDHCDFLDGVDGNFDIIEGSDLISVTWCRFRYRIPFWPGGPGGNERNQCSNLVGYDDKLAELDEGHLNVTFANCWWDEGCSERMPRMRFGNAHVFNCLYTCSDNLYCIGAGYKSNIYAEKNAFVNVNSPWMLWATKTDYTDYNITMTGNIGAPDIQERSGDADYFKPIYSYRAYDVQKVQEVVSNRDFGAGATL